jgi:hypothetical protein
MTVKVASAMIFNLVIGLSPASGGCKKGEYGERTPPTEMNDQPAALFVTVV